MRTNCVAIVCCLHIGVDPPDVVKPTPCARLEAWLDPLALPQVKALDMIGAALQRQYEQWQHRARYKQTLDPTDVDVKKLCQSLRRAARSERVLFHYNGHGVPRPSQNGEIWVFNDEYTQYIPVSVYDLQAWVDTPSIYVFDCSAAGRIVEAFYHLDRQKRAEFQRLQETRAASNGGGGVGGGVGVDGNATSHVYKSGLDATIILAACGADDILPLNPELPADLFTSCLTTPIKVALRWCASKSTLATVLLDDIDKIPGHPNERKTPLGELYWIFTAVTDTIAWSVLPHDLFQKLFRLDSLVSSLFRSFLLADRIMRSVNCTPISHPKLPETHKHPMWRAWDTAAEFFLAQLEQHLKSGTKFHKSSFFTDQLTAFEMWLEFGSVDRSPPMQLPIVLQVLLSQAHRLRALVLLARFLDTGPWAVDLALSVGFFFYVLRLLQSPAVELRQVLVFILTKILAYDPSAKVDLVKEGAQQYFVNHLASQSAPARERVMSAFVLGIICRHYRPGQRAVLKGGGLPVFFACMRHPDPVVRRWGAVCLGTLWEKFEDAKWTAAEEGVCDIIKTLLKDTAPEVRAAAVFAVGTFVGYGGGADTVEPGQATVRRQSLELMLCRDVARLIVDGSPLVRREVMLTLSSLVFHQKEGFLEAAMATEGGRGSVHRSSSISMQSSGQSDGNASPNSSPSLTPMAAPVPGPVATPSLTKGLRVSLPHTGVETIMDPELESPGVNSPASHSRQTSRQRKMLWKIVLAGCRDPHPSVNTVALHTRRFIVSHLQSSSSTGLRRNMSMPNFGRAHGDSVHDNNHSGNATSNGGTSATLGGGSGGPDRSHSVSAIDDSVVGTSRSGAAAGVPPASDGVSQPSLKKVQSNTALPRYDGSPVASRRLSRDRKHPKMGSSRASAHGAKHPSSSSSSSSSRSRTSKGGAPSSSSSKDKDRSKDALVEFPKLSEVDPRWTTSTSTFFQFCASYFRETLMGAAKSNDTVEAVLTREWRKNRNAEIRTKAESLVSISSDPSIADHTKKAYQFDQVALFHSTFDHVSSVVFHPYENILVACDFKDRIGVWDHKELKRTNRFSNENPRGTRMNHVSFINDAHVSLLLTGSDDGVVRLWKNAHWRGGEELVSAWTAVRDIVRAPRGRGRSMTPISSGKHHGHFHQSAHLMSPVAGQPSSPPSYPQTPETPSGGGSSSSSSHPLYSSGSPSLVVNWHQRSGCVIATGATDLIRVWDVNQERCTLEFPTYSETGVTALCCSESVNVLFSGYNDGSLRMFDTRLANPLVDTLLHHRHRVVKVHLQRGGAMDGRLVSADMKGDVLLSDIRMNRDVMHSIQAHQTRPLNAMAVHDYSPLLATGSHKQFIKILDMKGQTLNEIRYHEGFLGQRVGPISTLNFHPHKLILGAGALDAFISIHVAPRFK